MKKKSVSVFSNVCPKCAEGKVFRHFFFINRYCPNCDMLFEKEEGYFFGPMIISYFLTLLAALPLLLMALFKPESDVGQGLFAAAVVTAIVGPIIYRYSKLVWLHLETKFDDEMQAEKNRGQKLSDEAKKH